MIIFPSALFEGWKNQLGNFMIDYNTLTIEKIIAKGTYVICFSNLLYSYVSASNTHRPLLEGGDY